MAKAAANGAAAHACHTRASARPRSERTVTTGVTLREPHLTAGLAGSCRWLSRVHQAGRWARRR